MASILQFAPPGENEDTPAPPAEMLEGLVDAASEGMYVLDRERRIIYWNRAAEQLTGYSRREVTGRHCSEGLLRHCDGEGHVVRGGIAALGNAPGQHGSHRGVLVFLQHKEGRRIPVSMRSSPLFDRRGNVVGSAEFFQDATQPMEALEALNAARRAERTDMLTGIANRRLAQEVLDHHIAGRTPDVGVIFADLDNFKRVNDWFGHSTGDRVLTEVGRTLAAAVRSSDTVARWGGEEFVIVAPATPPGMLLTLAERLRAIVAAIEMEIVGEELSVTISMGGTVLREGESAGDVLDRADRLMYRSKREGKDRVTIG